MTSGFVDCGIGCLQTWLVKNSRVSATFVAKSSVLPRSQSPFSSGSLCWEPGNIARHAVSLVDGYHTVTVRFLCFDKFRRGGVSIGEKARRVERAPFSQRGTDNYEHIYLSLASSSYQTVILLSYHGPQPEPPFTRVARVTHVEAEPGSSLIIGAAAKVNDAYQSRVNHALKNRPVAISIEAASIPPSRYVPANRETSR